jgi:uncharacterized membrane protein
MNGAHLHLLLNHVPVLGTVFGVLLLGFSLWRKNDVLTKAALTVLVLVAGGAAFAYLTGEPAEGVLKGIPGVSLAPIEPHEELAGVALWASVITGVIALVVLFLSRREKPVGRVAGYIVLVAALVVTGLMSWTAYLGGKIRHTEISASPARSVDKS